MNQMRSRWLPILALGIGCLLAATTGARAGGAKPLNVDSELTKDDTKDKEAPDCFCKVYKYQMTEGKTYRIDLKSKDFDAYLRLEDPSGKTVAENDDADKGTLDSRIVYKAPKSGEFKVVASSLQGGKTGKFSLAVVEMGGGTDPGPKVAAVPDGDIVVTASKPAQFNGKLSDTDPKDADGKFFKTYTVKLDAGKGYRIYMKGNDKVNSYLTLQDDAGKPIRKDEFGDPNDSGITFTPTKTAVYKVVASTFTPKQVGPFMLTITETGGGAVAPPDKGVIAVKAVVPTVVNGKIAATDPKDGTGKSFKEHAFHAEAGKTYLVEMKGLAGLDPFAAVKDSSGVIIAKEQSFNNNASILRFQPTKTGTYRAVMTANKVGAIGDYTLTISMQDVKIAKSQPITVTKDAPAKVQDRITTTDGTDLTGKHHKIYTFQADPKAIYKVEMFGGTLNPNVSLKDENGQTLKSEDFGDGKVSRLVYKPIKAGTIQVVAGGFNVGGTGDFTLTVSRLEVKMPKVGGMSFKKVNLAEINGRLTAEDGIDNDGKFHKVYSLNLESGKLYKMVMSAKGFGGYLRLQDSTGFLIKNEDSFDGNTSRLTYKAPRNETVRVVATSVKAGDSGDFNLTVTEAQPGAASTTDLAFEQVKRSEVNGRLTAEDGVDGGGKFFKAYNVPMQPGKLYKFELVGKGLDGMLRLEDKDGRVVKNEDFSDGRLSRLSYRATKAETLRIVTTTFKAGATGDYTLTIIETDDKGGGLNAPPPGGFQKKESRLDRAAPVVAAAP